MQRKLAYALSPAPHVPLCFMLAAPWFALAAALVLLGAGAPALASRWTMPLLAATHLLTLGYLSMTMAGSMLQLIPVVAGVPVRLGRTGAAFAWCGLAAGTPMLACALGAVHAMVQGALRRRAEPLLGSLAWWASAWLALGQPDELALACVGAGLLFGQALPGFVLTRDADRRRA